MCSPTASCYSLVRKYRSAAFEICSSSLGNPRRTPHRRMRRRAVVQHVIGDVPIGRRLDDLGRHSRQLVRSWATRRLSASSSASATIRSTTPRWCASATIARRADQARLFVHARPATSASRMSASAGTTPTANSGGRMSACSRTRSDRRTGPARTRRPRHSPRERQRHALLTQQPGLVPFGSDSIRTSSPLQNTFSPAPVSTAPRRWSRVQRWVQRPAARQEPGAGRRFAPRDG
jgi:hypothetical protein